MLCVVRISKLRCWRSWQSQNFPLLNDCLVQMLTPRKIKRARTRVRWHAVHANSSHTVLRSAPFHRSGLKLISHWRGRTASRHTGQLIKKVSLDNCISGFNIYICRKTAKRILDPTTGNQATSKNNVRRLHQRTTFAVF